MRRVAVIGSNSYIGKHVVKYLEKYNLNIECYDVLDFDYPNYTKVNIVDKDSVKKINLNVDYIFMFSGLTGTYAGFDKYESYVNINELGLLNLLDTIRNSEYRPKIVFPSTRLVYRGEDKPLKEDDDKDTKTLYAVNKIACEGLLHAYKESFDIPYTIFRICIPYGNLLSTDYSFGTIGSFISQAKAGNDICLYGGGNIKRTFTHMEDLCYQMVEGAFADASDGQIYNVGGETLTLREAAEIIAKTYGVRVASVDWPERDLRIESGHTYFDDGKIQDLLKLQPYRRLVDFSKDL